eukprot:GHVR01036156.1.p2 GENE.GHVR01036156.1~~GHVR01036156.1.p2  ORF type:complete len:104 (-),score=9.95 GHVR01036156.1:3989-4300(-)
MKINAQIDEHLFFLDETGFNFKTGLRYGWSKKGTNANLEMPDSAGKNFSVVATIGRYGLVGYTIVDGPAQTATFIKHLKEEVIPNIKAEHDIVIMDNCPIHKT